MLSVKLDNNKEISVNPNTQYNYMSHGYALTDYKSQGQTAKHVIYHADTDKGVNFNQAYVGITRGKESVTIYTNDKATLLEAVKQEQAKTTTLDYNIDQPSLQASSDSIQASDKQEKVASIIGNNKKEQDFQRNYETEKVLLQVKNPNESQRESININKDKEIKDINKQKVKER